MELNPTVAQRIVYLKSASAFINKAINNLDSAYPMLAPGRHKAKDNLVHVNTEIETQIKFLETVQEEGE